MTSWLKKAGFFIVHFGITTWGQKQSFFFHENSNPEFSARFTNLKPPKILHCILNPDSAARAVKAQEKSLSIVIVLLIDYGLTCEFGQVWVSLKNISRKTS